MSGSSSDSGSRPMGSGSSSDSGSRREQSASREPILSVRDLQVTFRTKRGEANVVNGVSYDLHAAETLAIVGESGSGKSVSSLSLMGLVPQPPAVISGEAHLEGQDLLRLSDAELRRVRGNDIAMVFQDPMTSLNPVLRIGRQITEHMELHLGLSESEARDRAVDLLAKVELPSPEQRLDAYPHQLSGGMRQRVMIAVALACEPKVLIADEATTALDVTTQAQIIQLIDKLQESEGMAVIWITHDLGVVAGMADRVLVMYAGQVVEEADVDDLFTTPRHPYTKGLLGSLPVMDLDRPDELVAIPGLPPDPTDLPPGCPFYPRCPYREDPRCEHERPPLRELAPGHKTRAFYDASELAPPEAVFSEGEVGS